MVMTLDPYIIDTLMADLVSHDRQPSAFLVYLTLTRWAHSPHRPQIAAGVSAIATVQAGPRLAAQTVAQVGSVRAELAGGEGRLWWLVRPLAWRIESSGGDSASVAVWAVTVLSLSGVAAPQSEFVTVTVDVERVDGRWLVAGVGEVAGPTPMAGPKDQPWDSGRFDGALGGFVRVGVEAGR